MSGQWAVMAGLVVVLATMGMQVVEGRPFSPQCAATPDAAECAEARRLVRVAGTPVDVEDVTPSAIDVWGDVRHVPIERGLMAPEANRADGHEGRVAGTVVPEPASLVLLGTGLAAIAGAVRRHRRLPKAD